MTKGNISVQTENIFPIIKQFLYSDQEIFLRELVSNAVDATSKIQTLSRKGVFEDELGDVTIEIILDKEAKTLTIRDKGVGMSESEVNKYLNQVAFSSAQDFLEKYKNESSIIGHFGLGFYSAFMVADRVEVVTQSHKRKERTVKWTCEGDPKYTLEKVDKRDRGSDIILHISDDATEYLEESRIQELLDKYCKFLPVEIKFGTKTEKVYKDEEDKEGTDVVSDNIVNNPNPLWKKAANKIKEEDYKSFYNELYPYSQPPMFWIHLNIDYPFNLTGVLYFPKISNSMEVQKNKIQLYSNQVYVTDEVKEIVPEFLTLLHGVIDSPDIPLNVSRSYLQSDQNVKKITSYITKKVAEKLNNLFKKKRESYEEKWKDLSVFVKYGMVSEEKFYDKAIKFALLENVDGKLFTIEEFREKIKAEQTDKYDKQVFLYCNHKEEQASYVKAAKDKGYDVLVMDNIIDNHFMQQLEQKLDKVTFVRVDSDIISNLVQKDETIESVLSEKETEKVLNIFKEKVAVDANKFEMKALSPDEPPVVITKPEFMRRMTEMQRMQGMDSNMMPEMYNVIINSNHVLISDKLNKMRNEEKKSDFAQYLYQLALLNQGMLKGEGLSSFVEKSIEFLK